MTKKNGWFYVVLILLIFMLCFFSLSTGSLKISPAELGRILFSWDKESVAGTIVWNIRFPRMLAALFLGGSLALSGYLLQTFFANPIAGPFVLGISSGAKLIVAILMVGASMASFRVHSSMMVMAAFLGSLLATGFVIFSAKRVRSMSILVVCGVMIGYISSAITELLVAFADDSNIVNLHNWSQGSYASTQWSHAAFFIPLTVFGVGCSILLSKNIEAYLFGEQYAFSVGVNVKKFRVFLILVSSLLSATVTAFAGPVSFVGIAVPHVIRKLFRTAKPRMIIAGSFLGGAAFSLFADLLARNLFRPMEISISTITAVFGAPVVISMMMGKNRNRMEGV